MQNPVGFEIKGTRAELTNFWEVIINPFGWSQFLHVVPAGFVLGGFFVLGVSGYHILKKRELQFFKKSFKIAAIWTLIWALWVVISGHYHGSIVAHTQPAKLAAMEAIWETKEGADFALILIPDEKNEKNVLEKLKLPRMVSFLAYHDFKAKVKGLREWSKQERPPVNLTFWSFRIMVGLGFLFLFLAIWAMIKRDNPETSPILLRLLILNIPLPYIASQLGWIVAEVGRQPWIVI